MGNSKQLPTRTVVLEAAGGDEDIADETLAVLAEDAAAEEAKKLARAVAEAQRRVRNRRLTAARQDPDYWRGVAAKRGYSLLRDLWESDAIPAYLAVRPGRWQYRPDGLYVIVEGRGPQFVMSPAVRLARLGNRYAVRVDGTTKVVDIDPPAGRGSGPKEDATAILKQLTGHGLTLGGPVTVDTPGGETEEEPAAVWAAGWLLGVDTTTNSLLSDDVVADLREARSHPEVGGLRRRSA